MTDSIHLSLPERFEAQEEIGRGGMGAVWRVVDRQFQRPLAVKVMRPDTAKSPEDVARFEREAQLTGSLQHPAIPPVVDRGMLKNGAPYFSLKLIEGETLAVLLQNRNSPQDQLARFLEIFLQVCQGVGYAHSQQIIHRDLKPANIMVGAFSEVQVMDWGMAKRIADAFPIFDNASLEMVSFPHESGSDSDYDPEFSTVSFVEKQDGSDTDSPDGDTDLVGESPALTRAGQILGTLAYMPPEQAQGDPNILTPQSDVFALGGILCKILTGQAPYGGTTSGTVFQKVLEGDLDHALSVLNACGADSELVSLAIQCLERNPSDRPANAFVVAEEIRRYQETIRQRLEREKTERGGTGESR